MDTFPPGLLDNVGTVTVVVIVGWLIFTGRLVPRRTYEDIVHDRDEWRAAHRISETARVQAADQVEHLLENTRTTDAFIGALAKAAGAEAERSGL